ncbi:hypothetical protein K469DRAFT_693781 [Zopfia rhizophila CBS 207.26]|uniref:Uncharacterized protein n=1 Tax=Zopfia rhizophila CBS 207.26 TaxID=1314779 RepID=A0A6A6DK63_9PEZI|nr:hypothetical protein K469DRAFT_693781 [Zopfia rhizophila CBS 207.26]
MAWPHPSLGTCIRRVEVKTNTQWIQDYHGLWIEHRDFQSLSVEQKEKRLESANELYFNTYLAQFRLVLGNRSLPHLEYLDWKDSTFLERPFFNSLVCSSVKHLKLSEVCAAEDFEVEVPPSGMWPLRSLEIEMHLAQGVRKRRGEASDVHRKDQESSEDQ